MNALARLLLTTALLCTGCLAVAGPFKYRQTLIEVSKAWGSVVADFNDDGHDDIFITGHDPNDRIWRWTPSGYVATSQILPAKDRHDCDAADVNLDGRLDFYCAAGAEKGNGFGLNELWLQRPDGLFAKVNRHGAEDPYGRSRYPLFFDLNHDGLPDIYSTNLSTERPDGELSINRVFVNQGDSRFLEVTTLATGARGDQCVAKGDVDGDGWDDLVVCDLKGPPHVYRNNHAGNFEDLAPGSFTDGWKAAKLADMDGDGRDDLVIVTLGDRFQVWLNRRTPPYFPAADFSEALGAEGRSIAIGEFTGDGRKDAYVVLRDANCMANWRDRAPDVIFQQRPGNTYTRIVLPQDLQGCGLLADVVDGDKVLLENGGYSKIGPNLLLTFQ